MILILVARPQKPGMLIAEILKHARAAGADYLVCTVPSLFLRFDNALRTQIIHREVGPVEPSVVFHWIPGQRIYRILDALDIAGYRLINPLRAWYIGRNKCLQLTVFEREGIRHPWTVFAEDARRAAVADHVGWHGGEYVLKPHAAGRGIDVKKTDCRRMAAAMLLNTPRYQQGVLVQEYLDHTPKYRHHFRVNVIGGRPVAGHEVRAADGEWITNRARGGRSMAHSSTIDDVPREVVRLAVRAATAIGADYSGVDLIEGADGAYYVLEVNEFPGFGRPTTVHLARYVVEVANHQESTRKDPGNRARPSSVPRGS